jgi:hypothetical protein
MTFGDVETGKCFALGAQIFMKVRHGTQARLPKDANLDNLMRFKDTMEVKPALTAEESFQVIDGWYRGHHVCV